MIKSTLRYLRRSPAVVTAVIDDPLEALFILRTKLHERREHRKPPCAYDVSGNWERQLDVALAKPGATAYGREFRRRWPDVLTELRSRGLRIGPATFGMWNDGDPELVRAVWTLVRLLRPEVVVETGVARGLTTRFILEALALNERGHLWSIDLPPPLQRDLHPEIGAAVPPNLRDRWTYVRGSSRRRLQTLLARLGSVGLFVHDSMHTEDNVLFEMERAWPALSTPGAIVVDDIDLNWGFNAFVHRSVPDLSLVCQAEPLRPDHRRRDGKGLFGIITKL